MSFGLGYVLGEGLLGAAMGAGDAVADTAKQQQQADVLALREQRLSQLRTQEHAANTASDIAAKRADANTQAATDASFYKNTQLPATPISNTASATYDDPDNPGQTDTSTSNTVTAQEQPSRQAQADYRMEQAKQSGRPDLIKQTYEESKDIRGQSALDLRNQTEQHKNENYQRGLDIKQQTADANQQKIEALLGGGAKTPAKIAEVQALTDMFGGDQEKALAVAYGVKDKPRSDAVLSLSKTLIAQSAYSDKPLQPDEAIARAEKFVDTLRAKDAPTKGGASMRAGNDSDPGAALTNEILGTSGAAKAPPATVALPGGKGSASFTGRYNVSGKPIYKDASGALFVGQ